MLKVLIFDMDGTIVNTDDVLRHTWYEVFEHFYGDPHYVSDDTIRAFSGPSLKDTINKYFSKFNYDEVRSFYYSVTGPYYDKYACLFKDETEVLQKLYDDGYTLAIFTNKNRDRTFYCLDRLGLRKFFSYVVTSDDIKNTKPHREGIDKILEYYKIHNNEAILIGDTIYDYFARLNGEIKCMLLKVAKREFPNDIYPVNIFESYFYLYRVIKEYVD